LSGHQAKIDAWRTAKAEQNTHKKRPDLLKK
jgi:tRNA G37 N-methylase TrmD